MSVLHCNIVIKRCCVSIDFCYVWAVCTILIHTMPKLTKKGLTWKGYD